MSETADRPKHRPVFWFGVFAGALLFLIGIRFLLIPASAQFTFGLGSAEAETVALHYVIGLRDLWLGALAVAFALLRDWRALGLWLLMAAAVCWADAIVVATHNGPSWAIAFHTVSGVFCLIVGFATWRRRAKY